jgi:hypothetical protein
VIVACFCGVVYRDQDSCPNCGRTVANRTLLDETRELLGLDRDDLVLGQPDPGYGRPACS